MTTDYHSQNTRPELAAYEAALPQILPAHNGEFVVIHGQQLERFFDSYNTALSWAYEKFGLDPFFVKRVSADETVVHYTRDLGPCRR